MTNQEMVELVQLLRKTGVCIYIATDEIVARDVQSTCNKAASAIETLLKQQEEMREALTVFVRLERSIKIDIGSAHKARGAAASDFMREDDADFRRELEAAFDKARASLTKPALEDGHNG